MIVDVTSDIFKNKVVEIIRNYMGDTMAQMYSKFYENKDNHLILDSVNELLIEFVGPQKASEIISTSGLSIVYDKN